MSKVKPGAALHDFYKTNGEEFVVTFREPSLTRQEFAEECDINSLMKRYEGHNLGPGGLPNLEPMYCDFTEMPTDLLGYMAMMDTAQKAFMTLSAQVRRAFDNNPVAFVDFASDPENLEQMRDWGLAPRPQASPPGGTSDSPAGSTAPTAPVHAAPAAPGAAGQGPAATPGKGSTHGST